jgi:putative tryptophan/tyrosine transport system substrate-binding protein
MAICIRRRKLIATLAGATVWPLAARAQQVGQMRLIAFFSPLTESDPEAKARSGALLQGLEKLGWINGRNLRIVYRWAGGDPVRLRAYAAELVAMKPELIFAAGNSLLSSLREATQDIPIVFAQVPEPVEFGIVTSLARPGANITGMALYDQSEAAKLLELLKDIAPLVMRVAFLYDPINPSGPRYLAVMEKAAPKLGTRILGTPVRNADEIARAITELAREPNGGLIAHPSAAIENHRDLIITLAAQHKLPNVWQYRYYVVQGGLASYGTDLTDHYRQAAWYVDRILKGANPGDLPVQLATKFELVIKLKIAKALGLTIPEAFLQRADEIIE